MDPVVPEPLGQIAYGRLKEKGYNANYKTYPMQHGVCAEEVMDVSKWIRKILV